MNPNLQTFIIYLIAIFLLVVSLLLGFAPSTIELALSNGLDYWPVFGALLTLLLIGLTYQLQVKLQKADLQKVAIDNEHRQTLKALKKSHALEVERLSTALDSGRLAYWEWDVKKNTAYFSDQWQEMLGYSEHNLEHNLHTWQSRIHPADQAAVQTLMLKTLAGEKSIYENAHRVRHADGHYLWVYDRGRLLNSENGQPRKLSCVRIDISSHKELEAELMLDKVLLEHTQESIAIIDENLHFIRTNPAFDKAFGFSEEEMSHLNLRELLDNLQDESPLDILAEVNQHKYWRGELALHQVSGEIALACMIDIQYVIHEATPYYTLVYTDITELKRTQARLNHLANIDQVTLLPNRHAFFSEIQKWLNQYARTHSKFTLMFLDLDNFKTVNDTLGHDAGDQLLKAVSQLLTENLAPGTFMARVGGDEFVILCKNFTDATQLQTIGDKLNDMLRQPFKIGQHDVQIGSSIGMAVYPQHGDTQETLLKNADIAMYQAKKAGKGQHHIFQPEKDLL